MKFEFIIKDAIPAGRGGGFFFVLLQFCFDSFFSAHSRLTIHTHTHGDTYQAGYSIIPAYPKWTLYPLAARKQVLIGYATLIVVVVVVVLWRRSTFVNEMQATRHDKSSGHDCSTRGLQTKLETKGTYPFLPWGD